ncbi:MAG TPA: CoA ester lyase [Candidatus Rokubacteria bacterium]|nr:CoA ester lyase [Candidatus Rokubacteria bacterium]
MRARRSLLFVCGAEPAALEAARGSDADSLILDLEDTVTPERKPRARALVAEALGQPARPGLERTVRVNPPSTSWFADDVAAVVAAGADALVVPKVETAADVRRVARRLAATERARGRPAGAVRLLALVETPRGVLNASAIAGASARLDALVIGHVDLSRALGIREAGATEGTILHARCHLVLAAKAAGRQAVDAVFMDLDDPDGLTAEARQGLRLGFTGKLVIDERQVALVHAAFRPSEAEVAYARRLVAAWDAAVAAGTGVFVFEGRVIDRPVVEAERTVLARAALP